LHLRVRRFAKQQPIVSGLDVPVVAGGFVDASKRGSMLSVMRFDAISSS
jgi:hypothetical protein